MKRSGQIEKEAALSAASMMAAAARTAPKTRGIDNIEIFLIDDEPSRMKLIDKMREISRRDGRPSFERDAASIGSSNAILVIGAKAAPAGLNCGYCGHPECSGLSKANGICAYNSIDLGIAAGSAVSVAARLHVDNRLMYSIGKACLELGFFPQNVKQALGIPLSVTGKSPFSTENNTGYRLKPQRPFYALF